MKKGILLLNQVIMDFLTCFNNIVICNYSK